MTQRDCQPGLWRRCCPMCPSGYRLYDDCTRSYSTHCLPCPEGTFMDQLTYHRQCYNCTNCDGDVHSSFHSGLPLVNNKLAAEVMPQELHAATMSLQSGTAPDLNPTEHIWDIMSRSIHQLHAAPQTVQELVDALVQVWEEVPQETIHHLIRSMPRCSANKVDSKIQFSVFSGSSESDSECSPCSEGTFSDGTFTSCQNHTECDPSNQQLLRPGTGSQDAECGELEPDRTKEIISVSVGGAVVLFSAAVCVFIVYRLKKNRSLTRGIRRGTENGYQEMGSLNYTNHQMSQTGKI
ncbi:tumor necrosis factor receptor superfamily member 5-like [Halichoeres trimaculatus]|uniref:tumor necrosis factor receptor superfamily member 5-like n=1 Tax=Halichoeres trimaculatus TaxID=147232 RepID=UPI003D9EF295